MLFCKFDKTISLFRYEEAVWHHLVAAPALNELPNMTGMLDFVVMEIYFRFHGSEKKQF